MFRCENSRACAFTALLFNSQRLLRLCCVVLGGFVVHNRVMGRLAVSRAIGDIAFKTGTNGAQMVTGAPEVGLLKLRVFWLP